LYALLGFSRDGFGLALLEGAALFCLSHHISPFVCAGT
jgi:hypothetical protein